MTTPPLWPVTPNWATPYEETLEYRTDIFTSRSGREQRRALRQTHRRSLNFAVMLDTPEQGRALRLILDTGQDKAVYVVDPIYVTTLSAAAASGDTAVFVSEIPTWLQVNRPAMLGGTQIVVPITLDTVTGQVDLLDPLTADVAAGSQLRLVAEGLLNASASINNATVSIATMATQVDVSPGSETPDPGTHGIEVASGYETLTTRENWKDAVTDDYGWTGDTVDFGFGLTENNSIRAAGTRTRRLAFLFGELDEAESFKQFFRRQRGQRGAFIVPTWSNDLPLHSDIVTSDTTLLITGSAFAAYDGHRVNCHICIVTVDGRRLYREVLGIIGDTMADTATVTLDREIPCDLAVGDVSKICWAPLCRFATDQVTIAWHTNSVAIATTAVQTLYWETAEPDALSVDSIVTYVLEVFGYRPDLFDRFDHLLNVDFAGIFN